MAKGLFAVYRDDAAGLAPPPAPSTSRGASTNKLAAAPQRRQFDGLGQREKENMDPLSMIRKGALLGKGKAGLGKSAKSGDGGSTCAPPQVRRGLAAASQVQKTTKTTTTATSTNGICTGTLRTRVLPDLPPLPATNSTPAAATATATLSNTRQPIRRKNPSVVEVRLPPPPESAESSPRSSSSSCDRSYASATDSGYAQSPGAPLLPVHQNDGEQVEFNTDDNKLEAARTEGMFADEMDSDMSLASVEEEEVAVTFDANRRARALTESPLAEVTQAFTGLGGFSVANTSPSPALHHPAAPVSSYRPALLSHPTSPTRQNLSHAGMLAGGGPAGFRTFTGTTKRLKPGQTVPSAPKAAPGRTMRL
ncbi:hypothetical protein RHOSPDRAFT_32300 [Rhodotorula sp. JG-1b]|nr:hypothetical protein RHOSPDRAFT_32300 [Rhodotorula sp. JG-1b]